MSWTNNCFTLVFKLAILVLMLGACDSESPSVSDPTIDVRPIDVTICELEEEPERFNGSLVAFEAEAHALSGGRVELWSIEPCSYEKKRNELTTLPEMDAGDINGINLPMILDGGRKVVNIRVVGIVGTVSDIRKTIFGPHQFKHAVIQPVTLKQISETRDSETPAFPTPVQ